MPTTWTPPTVNPQTNEVEEDGTSVPTTTTPKKKKRKGRNFTFVIVPWSSAVVTNVIGLIKGLIDSKFPPGSTLRKLFNSKNVSFSYCVAKNMGHHIQAHNNKLLGRGGATLGACIERPCRESAQGACWEASGHCNAKMSFTELK